ncbi:glyoxylate/hydroxypyruvate reductase A [Marinicella sp. S1101]|uniref:2-hydroxyacid dehydrogenase n=1 Tax=Marinicella marina TaxID=2996016 RepID=UPI002260ACD6|nr:glyoxylate/hydroxypyruvate reductase A [Marinicella marina]MCX7552533.1 glyoxylate/hydroxypyruvate reductase A [Marinicella marina]MDJ1139409.1 glyoxylate/hydroxypyruvate reductase A [Marinicella marina]
MSIAVIITDRNTDELCQLLASQLPEVQIQQWPDIPHPETVELAVLWDHPAGITQHMPKLKAVISMGAGMDHIEQDQHVSGHIKQARIVTPALQQNMAQYVLQHVLAFHRHGQAYRIQQSNQQWQVLEKNQPMPVIGFLGLGALGAFVADRCVDLGFKTIAWTQQQKHPEHPCFHGAEGLQKVCEGSDYLVVLLPLNPQTKHIINRELLSWCGQNLVLINVARGAHVDEAALLQILDSGGIKAAVLDVFQQEPLPAEHPFWQHPKITITPHSSSRSDVMQTAQQVVGYYRGLMKQS